MRCTKNKRKYKRRTRNRYAGTGVSKVAQTSMNNAKGALDKTESKAKGIFNNLTGKLKGYMNQGTHAIRGLVAQGKNEAQTGMNDAQGALNKAESKFRGGKRRTRRRKRSRQRGGAETTEMLGGVTKVMDHINKLAPQLKDALGRVNDHAVKLSQPGQMGGKKRRRYLRKGGDGNDVFPQDKVGVEQMDGEKNPGFESNPVSNPETESKPESQMAKPTEETQENPSEEPETCSGFSKMVGLCETKDAIAKRKCKNDCIEKCTPQQKTQEKQSGGKVKKSKKKRKKRKNKSYKKRQ